MLFGRLALVAALVAVAAPAVAEFRRKDPASADPRIPFEKYTLPNGLEVLLVPEPSVPLVSVSLWYHVGSGNESYGKSGFAHLFEHMLFQGSKHVGVDNHFDLLKKAGVTNVNGTTNPDRTNYYEVLPSNQLELALWLESDRMGFLLDAPATVTDPDYFQKSLANQIDVVRNERRQRYDNVPYGKARFAVAEGLYPEGHPYRYLTIGKHEDLVRASPDDVKAFFKTWYVPSNATIAIAGDFDPAQAKQLVEKWFGKFPKSVKPEIVPVAAPPIASKEVTVTDSFAKLRQVQFVWHTPANFADGDAELDVVAAALHREGVGRLYKALVYDKTLAQGVSAFQSGSGFSGQFSIVVTLMSDADLDEVKRIVRDEVARLVKEPPTRDDIARVIAENERSAIRGLETGFGRAEQLQAYNHYLGAPDKLSWDLDRYRSTTPEKIGAVVAKYLTPDHMLTVITLPAPTGGK
jgi:predicted Zn-dependent peptidase